MYLDYHQLTIVALFIIMDIASGIAQAVANHTLSSEKMRRGIYHKLGYIMVIALAILCEYATMHLDLGFTAPLITPCVVMISLTEIVSIIENIQNLNPEIGDIGVFQLFANNKKRRKDDNDEQD